MAMFDMVANRTEAPSSICPGFHGPDIPLPEGTPDENPNQSHQLPCVRQTQPFFELPAEIRNVIYELAMPSKDRGDSLVITTPNWDDLMVSAVQPAITRVSKQARSEALPMFYGTNEFKAWIPHYDFKTLVKWADCTTSVPKPPKLRVQVYMLDKMSCNVGLRDLALAWRDIKHETIHLTIASAFPNRLPGKAQCTAVAGAIQVAEERKVAGDQRDETTIRHLLMSGVLGVCSCPVIAGLQSITTCSRAKMMEPGARTRSPFA